MALPAEAARIAAEFEFNDSHVNQAVIEFVAEMSSYITNNYSRNRV
jgi:hypothetical protein